MGAAHVNTVPIPVDFVTRSDTDSKPGGDTVQVESYLRSFPALGVDARIVPFTTSLDLRPGAIAHLINIDRPYEFLHAYEQTIGRSRVVSPIHHSHSAVREMREHELGTDLRSFVGRRTSQSTRELLSFLVRSVRSKRVTTASDIGALYRSTRRWPRLRRQLAAALDNADAVALLANGEGLDLHHDLGWSGRNGVVVPNGCDADPSAGQPTPWAKRGKAILIVGRVEPRKRQLEVARAAARTGTPVTFIGKPNAANAQYTADFEREVQSSAVLNWLGPLEHEAVLKSMRSSRVLLNASWVEVQSLVDLEAVGCGCHVVCTTSGNTKELSGDSVTEVDTSDIDKLLGIARTITERENVIQPAPPLWQWSDAARSLVGVYAAITTESLDSTPAALRFDQTSIRQRK